MGRKAVITGGTGGIGLHVAVQLSERGYDVTVVGRDSARGQDAVGKIGNTARFLQADLSSLDEVRSLGARLAEEGPLHLLVNNVGGMWSTRRETADGLEASFALNHLSPVVLTTALLDALRAGKPSRIVDVTSSSITTAVIDGLPTYEDVEQAGDHYGMAVTGRAKLAHLSHSLDLAEQLRGSGVSVIVVDPVGAGAVDTPNAAEMTPDILPPAIRGLWDQIQAGMGSAADVAGSVVTAATDPAFDDTTGVVLGPDAAPSDSLVKFVTPEISASVRELTARVLAA
ncbi:SDR family NAD(P)-dependent oxidoreductase [Streptomyces parvulus]|uniref:SDR family NAD(P)-dependent oxidoreductase n=2 Tax=Streptomyces parvulus TaxID=146923 RepID=A0A369UWG1_9ACTN|nr:SDR family NAD(P)-dependent oxidoreductase [Streptomyces parvulus]